MTIREIEKAISELHNLQTSEAEQKQYKELKCRDMIMNILTYGDEPKGNYYLREYLKELGENRVNAIIDEQTKTFTEKYKVMKNTYGSYNGLLEI